MHPLNIAFVASLINPIHEPHIGGAQAFLSDLAQELTLRGHRVTVYAAEGSSIPKVEVKTFPLMREVYLRFSANGTIALIEDDLHQKQAKIFEEIFRQIEAEDYDLIHNHALDLPAYLFSFQTAKPAIHTLHIGNIFPQLTRILSKYHRTRLKTGTVAISEFVAKSYQNDFPVDTIIYNGINPERIPFGSGGESLLFAGRISPEKGGAEAIEIALRSGRSLQLAGGIYDPHYFEKTIEPLLQEHSDQLIYLGHLARSELYERMGKSSAVLMPSRWEEPFGLVALEAQAAGTPVIAFASGALPEIIKQGKTGFAVRDIPEALAALKNLDRIDRQACRNRVEEFFNAAQMVEKYEAFYFENLGEKDSL